MFQIRPRRAALATLACTSISIAALSIAAPAAHADALGNAISADASSYVGRDYTMGPWNEFWCADFVKRVWTEKGVSAASWMTASVPTWINSPNYHPLGTYTPQPGDAIIWNDDDYNDANNNPGSHISIVTSYSNGMLTDVGGDEGGGQNPNLAWWATSHVAVDEDGGRAFDPTKKLFAGQPYEMWVRGYVSPGTSSGGGSGTGTLSITGGVSNGGTYSGNITITVTPSTVPDNSTVYLHIDGNTYTMSGSGTSYSYPLNVSSLATGSHTVFAGAYFGGTAADSATDTITVAQRNGVLGSITGSGRPDIVAIRPTDGALLLYPNTGGTGTNTYGSPSLLGTGWAGYNLAAIVDLYGTGHAGIMAVNPSGNMMYYPNTGGTGTNTFGTPTLLGTGWGGYQIVGVAPLDGDTKPGILTISPVNGNMYYYHNAGGTGTGTFGTTDLIGTGWGTYNAELADIDNDGKPDIVTVNAAGNLLLYPNTGGTGTSMFGTSSLLGTGWSGWQAVDAAPNMAAGAGAGIVAIDPSGNMWSYPNTGGTGTSTYGNPTELGTGWNGWVIN